MPCSSVFPCSREAVWWVDQQGRTRTAARTAHVTRWVQEVSRKIGTLEFVQCHDCDEIFTTVEQLGTVRPLRGCREPDNGIQRLIVWIGPPPRSPQWRAVFMPRNVRLLHLTLFAQIQLGLSSRLSDGVRPIFRFRTQAVASLTRHSGVRQRIDNRIPGEAGR